MKSEYVSLGETIRILAKEFNRGFTLNSKNYKRNWGGNYKFLSKAKAILDAASLRSLS